MNSIQELHFTGKDVNERWAQVKEDFWGRSEVGNAHSSQTVIRNNDGSRDSRPCRRAALGTQYQAPELSQRILQPEPLDAVWLDKLACRAPAAFRRNEIQDF